MLTLIKPWVFFKGPSVDASVETRLNKAVGEYVTRRITKVRKLAVKFDPFLNQSF